MAKRKGMEGHKQRCQCVACKAMRKGSSSSSSKPKAHTGKIKRALAQAKRGAQRAASNGDAKSWSQFTATIGRLERELAKR